MLRPLAAAALLLGLSLSAVQAQEVRLSMMPVDGIFSFTPGAQDLDGPSVDAGPVLRPGPPDQGRLEAFLDAHDGDTLLIVRGGRVLREVPADEDLYDANGIIPLVDGDAPADQTDALEAPDRVDIWAVGTAIDLTTQVEAADEARSPGGAPAIMLRLTPEGGDMVNALTTVNAGRQIATLLGRDILNAPVVQGPVDGDTLALSFASPEDPARESWVLETLRALARGPSAPPQ